MGLDFDLAYTPSLTVSDTLSESPYFHDLVVGLEHRDEVFFVSAYLVATNDDRYYSTHSLYWSNHFFQIENSGVGVTLGPLRFRGGRLAHFDVLEAPYSLFVSSRGISAPMVELAYDDGLFFYLTRWIGLTMYSALAYPNRGAVVKWYGLDFGEFRFGFQDSVVFTNRIFDFEYFASPIPGFFTQYTQTSVDAPWRKSGNDNSIMGFFAEYAADAWDLSAQLLIDDANSNFIFSPDGPQNPFKIAWMLGGTLDTAVGAFRFDHAGATKYTFQPAGGPGYLVPYGYTYIPDTDYESAGQTRAIPNQDNYIGYPHGENNLAFRVGWDHAVTFPALGAVGRGPSTAAAVPPAQLLSLAASLEYRISGSKSPANPWHDYLWYTEDGEGSRLLDEDVLEHRLLLTLAAGGELQSELPPFLRPSLHLELTGGFVANPLDLRDPVLHIGARENRAPIFSPTSGVEPVFNATLTLSLGLEP